MICISIQILYSLDPLQHKLKTSTSLRDSKNKQLENKQCPYAMIQKIEKIMFLIVLREM